MPESSSLFNSTDYGALTPGFTPVSPDAVLGSDIAYVAYRIAGILAEPGRGYSASEGVDALRIMNSMINAFQAERIMVFAFLRTVWGITPNQQDYRIGNTGVQLSPTVRPPTIGYDWGPIPRPQELKLAGYIFTNSSPAVENPLRLLTYQEWAALSPKDLESTVEYIGYYRADVPNGVIQLWPVPTDPSVQVSLYTWQNIQKIPQLSTAMILPPAFQALFEYGLAIRLAGMFPRRAKLDPDAKDQYNAAKVQATGSNEPELKMVCEWGSGGVRESRGRFMIQSGTWMGGGSGIGN